MERFTIKVDTDTPLNLSLMCRLCGTNNTGNISILNYNMFYIEDGDPELWRKILACVGIQVTKNDKMPQNICHLCHDKILDFFEFREMCLSINSQIRQMLGLPALVEMKPLEDNLLLKKNKKERKKPQKRASDQINTNPKPSKIIKVEYTNASSTDNKNSTRNKSVKKVTSGNILSSKGGNKKVTPAGTSAEKDKDQKLDMKPVSFIGSIPVIEIKDDDEDDLKKSTYCNICNKKFNSIKYDEHLTQVHIPRIVPYHCIACNETIMKKMEIKNHNLWHKLSKTPYECGRCEKRIENLGTYTRHINECLTFNKSRIYRTQKCMKCYQEFQTQNLYFWHPCITSSLKCPKCYKTFATQQKTLKHMVRCSAKASTKSIKTQNSYNNQKLNNEANKAFTDNKACVMIPSLSLASTSNDKSNKKSKKLNKKDVERFDNLLKDAYETLQSIKQEPKDSIVNNGVDALKSDSNEEEQETVDDNSNSYHNNDDDGNDMATYSSDENDDIQPNVSVKQEIDINDTEFEKVINGTNGTTTLPKLENIQNVQIEQQPTIKLKIKMEHGTLNSSLIGGENVNSDLNSGDGSSDDANIKKRKKKRKRTDKEGDEDTAEIVKNIKQEPLDENVLTEQQSATDENVLTEQQSATEATNEEDLNSNTAPLLPVISGVSSLAASELTENSKLPLPIISAVHSEVEMPNTLENRNSTISGVVIKQEVIDEVENNDLQESELTPLDVTTAENNEAVAGEVVKTYGFEVGSTCNEGKNGLNSKSINEIPTKQSQNDDLPLDMEMVRIKKEIDYEEYANETYDEQNIQNCNDNYENETSFVTSNITVKEEINLNYENEYYDNNLMNYDGHSTDNNGDNNVDATTTATISMELQQLESQDQNVTEEKESEKNDDITSNIKSSDSTVFSFKRILLKASNTINENVPKDENDIRVEDKNDDNLERVNEEEIRKELNVTNQITNNCTLDLENTSNMNEETNVDSCIEDESSKLESSENDKQLLEKEKNTIEEKINSQKVLSTTENNLGLQKSFNKSIENKNQDEFTITSILCGAEVDKLLNSKIDIKNNENNDNIIRFIDKTKIDLVENSETCNVEESSNNINMENNQSNLESNIPSTSNLELNEMDSKKTTSQKIFENEQINISCHKKNENSNVEDVTKDNNNLLQSETDSNLDETIDESKKCEKINEFPIQSMSSHLKNDTILLNNVDTNITDENQNSSNIIPSNSNVLVSDNINEIAENNNNENIEKELKNNQELEQQQELRDNEDNDVDKDKN